MGPTLLPNATREAEGRPYMKCTVSLPAFIMSTSAVSTYQQRQEWRERQLLADDGLVESIPKIELHVHIEGTMSPELRWELAQRNNIPLTAGSDKVLLTSLKLVRDAYTRIRGRIGSASADASRSFTFFEIYYGGFDLLQTAEDFYDLAMAYFERAARMNVRYCEPFFDPQGHTRRGISFQVIMSGFSRAQVDAKRDLNVSASYSTTLYKLMYYRSNHNGSCASFATCLQNRRLPNMKQCFLTEIQ